MRAYGQAMEKKSPPRDRREGLSIDGVRQRATTAFGAYSSLT